MQLKKLKKLKMIIKMSTTNEIILELMGLLRDQTQRIDSLESRLKHLLNVRFKNFEDTISVDTHEGSTPTRSTEDKN